MRPSKRELVKLYATMTDDQIGRRFGITGRSIGDWRRKYGIETKPRERRYTLNVDFFEKIDTEKKAYALGLIAADGYVTKAGKQVFVALKATDEHILHDLGRAIGSDAPVRDKIAGGFPGSCPQKYICFGSRKLVSDLAKHGVVPGKAKRMQYPQLPWDMHRHFARGLFDGDGHIRVLPKRAFYFLGTEQLIDKLREVVANHTGAILTKNRAQGCWRLSGYGGSTQVLEWMYRDAMIFLRRKQRVYLQWNSSRALMGPVIVGVSRS